MRRYLKFVLLVSLVPLIVAIFRAVTGPQSIYLTDAFRTIDIVYARGGMMMHCPQNTYTVNCLDRSCLAAGQEIQRDCYSQQVEVTRTVSAQPVRYELVIALSNALVSLQPIKDPVYDPSGVICQDHTDDFPYFAITATTSQSQTVFVGSKCNAAGSKLWKVKIGNQWYNQTTGEIPAAYYQLLAAVQSGAK